MRVLLFALSVFLALPLYAADFNQVIGYYNSTQGGSSEGIVGTIDHTAESAGRNGDLQLSPYTASASGSIGYAHVYINFIGTGQTIEVGFWTSTGTFITSGSVTVGSSISAPQWVNFPLDSPASSTLGTDYVLGCISTDTAYSLWDDDSPNGHAAVSATLGSLTDISVPSFTSAGRYTIILNNTAGDPE